MNQHLFTETDKQVWELFVDSFHKSFKIPVIRCFLFAGILTFVLYPISLLWTIAELQPKYLLDETIFLLTYSMYVSFLFGLLCLFGLMLLSTLHSFVMSITLLYLFAVGVSTLALYKADKKQ